MSQTAALLGLAVPFEYDGVTYQVAPFDFEAEGLVGLELEGRALAVIDRHAKRLGPAAAGLYAEWRDACAAGRYDYPQPAALEFLWTREGRQLRAYLQLVRLNPRVTRELVAAIWDAPAPEATEGDPAPVRPFARLEEAMERATSGFFEARRGKKAA